MSQLTTSTDTYYTQSTIVTAQPQTIYTKYKDHFIYFKFQFK